MSKADILQSIRKHRPVFSPAASESTGQVPASSSAGLSLLEVFKNSLQAAGAEIIELKPEEVKTGIPSAWTAEYPASCSLEELDKIEHILFSCNFGVAENGAIWLEDKDLPHRILPFITQHLILKLDANKIVSTMQDAYQQIQLNDLGFGVFISGPSKTADIEQSLVYGAHGAKELTVIIVLSLNPILNFDF